MMESTLGIIQLPPTFTQQMMNRIDRTPTTLTPQNKPITPWIAVTATLIVTLFIGLGQRSTTRFQQPYSLDAPEPAHQVELIDAPMMHLQKTRPALVNRPGNLNPRDDKRGNRSNGTSFSLAAMTEAGIGRNDTEWTQTNGPFGGYVSFLFRASDGTLYAITGTSGRSIFRSRNGGDSWVRIYNGSELHSNGRVPLDPSSITEANGLLYFGGSRGFNYSINHGESWQWGSYPKYKDDIAIRAFSVIGSRVYIGRIKDGVAYSDDYGESWTPFRAGLPVEPPDKLVAVGTTLFAKVGDNLFRLKAGESSWTEIDNLPELSFLVVEPNILVFGNQTELHLSIDEGETWTPMAPDLENQFPMIAGVTAFRDTVCVLLNDGKLLRSTDYGRSWITIETSGLDDYYISPDNMIALSKHEVCIGNITGIFRWTDNESSWKQINGGLIGTRVDSLEYYENALYASTRIHDGIFKSIDGGNRWTPIRKGLSTARVGALAVSGSELYISVGENSLMDADVYRLADNRDSWIPVQTAMRAPYIDNNQRRRYYIIYSVAKLEVSGDAFYALMSTDHNYQLFRWQKGERFWTHISPDIGFDPNDFLKMSSLGFAVSGETVYFSRMGELLRSHDKGKTWSKIDAFPLDDAQDREINGLAVLGKFTYIAVSELGVFRTADHGAAWESVNEGLPGAYSWNLHLVGNTLYTTGQQGIFRLKKGQNSWVFVKPYPPYLTYMSSLAVAGSALYAGIGDGGVYRISLDNPDGD